MKKLTKIRIGPALFVLFLGFTGCQPCFYAPSAHNVPLFTEKGQVNGTASYQFGTISFGWNIQGAVAVTDHFALMGNYNHYRGNAKTSPWFEEEFESFFRSNMGEGGLGYYMPFGDQMVFEAYAGAGGSSINTDYDWYDNTGTSTVKTTCYFIQPAIGYYNKHMQLAFSSRFRFVDFRDISYSSTLVEDAKEYLDDLQLSHVSTFLEPAFTFRIGSENVKFQLQTMFSLPVGDMEVTEYDPFNINFGIFFFIQKKKNE